MSAIFIATTPRANYNALKHQGILVTDCYQQISSTLQKNLSPEHAAVFAQPFHTASGDAIDWYSQGQAPVSGLKQLPQDYQRKIKEQLGWLLGDIQALAEQLINSPDAASVTRGHILKLALSYPSDDDLYLVGSQPVIICWGFLPASAGVLPQDVIRRGEVRPQTATAGGAMTAAARGATTDETAPTAASAKARQTDTRQPGADNTQKRVSIWPPYLRQLLWLLLALAITLLALGLASHFLPGGINNFGCASARLAPLENKPVENALPEKVESSPELAEETGREGQYRQRLEDLRRQLIARAAQCRQAAPLAEEEKPDFEAHLPRSEEPEAEPEVKPPLQPERKPEAKPEIKPEVKPEEKPEPESKPQPKPERDVPLQIPPEAAQEDDLSFLEGCWVNTSNLYNAQTRQQLSARYCFDQNGNGSRVIIEPDGTRCAGSARARFDSSGKLIIQSDSASCNRGDGGYVPQRIECRGSASDTNCSGKEQGPQAQEWSANFRRQ